MPVLLANTQMQNVPVVCLMGTTATGKTDAAAHLVDALDAEIISVDSSLVYRGMDIGTAKPCLLYTSPSPRDKRQSRMPSSA